MLSPEQNYYFIKEDKSDGNTEGLPIGAFDDVIFGLFDSKMLGVAYS